MRKTIFVSSMLLAMLACTPALHAQDNQSAQPATGEPAPPIHYYHLELVVQELGADKKPTNSRSYTTTITTDSHNAQSSIRTGSKIPIATGAYSDGDTKILSANTQFQYIDVGVSIDANHTHEIGRQLSIAMTADVSSVGNASDTMIHQPVIRQNRWQSTVLIPIGKPTVIFTSDSLDNKSAMQVVATATLIPE